MRHKRGCFAVTCGAAVTRLPRSVLSEAFSAVVSRSSVPNAGIALVKAWGMVDVTAVTADDFIVFVRPPAARTRTLSALLAGAAVAFSLTASALLVYGPNAFGPKIDQTLDLTPLRPSTAVAEYSGMLDPALAKAEPAVLARMAPLSSGFEFAAPPPPLAPEIPHDVAAVPADVVVVPLPVPAPAPVVASLTQTSPQAVIEPAPPAPSVAATVPLPAPRPVVNREIAAPGPVRAAPRLGPAPRGGTTVVAGTPTDGRSFLERLFGSPRPSGVGLAYAAPEEGDAGRSRPMTATPTFGFDRSTAVYDIAAHTVYMPNGDRLEAHSGLGPLLDDPRYVNRPMRGATPPHVYDLTPREQPFHGVRALRLNPVGGGGVFGRTGLLAHTFMLGPKGDSNGCVSFRDYQAFLRAYERGEVRRLAVVARQE